MLNSSAATFFGHAVSKPCLACLSCFYSLVACLSMACLSMSIFVPSDSSDIFRMSEWTLSYDFHMISHVSIIPSCRKPGSPSFSGAFFFWGMIPIVPDRSNRAGNQLLIIQAPMGTGKNYIQIYTQFVVSSIFNIHNVTYTILCTQYCIYTHCTALMENETQTANSRVFVPGQETKSMA